jgi:hypothetical protein
MIMLPIGSATPQLLRTGDTFVRGILMSPDEKWKLADFGFLYDATAVLLGYLCGHGTGITCM